MKQWIIYKHTSMRSGKSYIGVTSRTMEARWKEHCNLAGKKGWTLVGNQHLLHKDKIPGNALTVVKVCITTGEVVAEYPSIIHAARENGVSENAIGERCRGTTKVNNINGYMFLYKSKM